VAKLQTSSSDLDARRKYGKKYGTKGVFTKSEVSQIGRLLNLQGLSEKKRTFVD
jgi:hypothetical protein